MNARQKEVLLEAVLHSNAEFTYDIHMKRYAISYPSARSDFGRLMDLGFLQQSDDGVRHFFFANDDLQRAVPGLFARALRRSLSALLRQRGAAASGISRYRRGVRAVQPRHRFLREGAAGQNVHRALRLPTRLYRRQRRPDTAKSNPGLSAAAAHRCRRSAHSNSIKFRKPGKEARSVRGDYFPKPKEEI
ncbi:MAG: hypothetical protein ACLTDR_03875 [Adlercreutzia equolifaciens]